MNKDKGSLLKTKEKERVSTIQSKMRESGKLEVLNIK